MAEDVLRERGLRPGRSSRGRDEPRRDDAHPRSYGRAASPRPSTRRKRDVRRGARTRCSPPGGLAVIGTERHESRRIDNQLRGRAGRQGDPGSHAVLPLAGRRPHASVRRQPHGFHRPHDGEDRHARATCPSRRAWFPRPSKALSARSRAMHFAARKNVLEYDDVMNLQRNAIYEERNAILDGKDLADRIAEIVATRSMLWLARTARRKLPSDDWDVKAVDAVGGEHDRPNDFASRPRSRPRRRPRSCSPTRLDDYLMGVYEREERHAWRRRRCASSKAQVMLRIIDARWMSAPAGDGLPEDGHRPARLRPARPARRIQRTKRIRAFSEPDVLRCTKTTCARCCAWRSPRSPLRRALRPATAARHRRPWRSRRIRWPAG